MCCSRLHHPIKKFKPAEPKVEEPLWPPYRPAHIQEKMEPYRQEVGQEVSKKQQASEEW